MTFEILAVLIIVLTMLVFFIGEWIPADLVAILGMTSLVLFGILKPEEAISGFSNPATITVMLMFVLSEAISQTGALNLLSSKIMKFSGNRDLLAVALLFIITAFTSMFINNTAAVAILIPVTVQISRLLNLNPSTLLMPLSFISMVGGVCTLIGTSTNLLAHDILVEHGYRGFSIFGFLKEGSIFLAVGLIYILLFKKVLIPDRQDEEDRSDPYRLDRFITHMAVGSNSTLINRKIDDFTLGKDGFKILSRDESPDLDNNLIQAGDVITIQSNLENLRDFTASTDLEILPTLDYNRNIDDIENRAIVEVVVSPHSKIISTHLSEVELFRRFGIKVMAFRHGNKIIQSNIDNTVMHAGDSLLLAIPRKQIEQVRRSKLFHVVNEPDMNFLKTAKIPHTLIIMALTIILAATALMPIYMAAFLGISALVICKVISLEEAYQSINWKIIFLLAGLISLGHGMEYSGATKWIANGLLDNIDGKDHMILVGIFFTLTMLLTSVISNNAAIVIVTPLALEASYMVGYAPEKLVMVVMFASSMCFITPIGYQTNMMVMGAGHYRFSDYLRFGGPMAILMIITALFVFA